MTDIDLSKLNYFFKKKPLLIGGLAKEYYGIRNSGPDIDFVVNTTDYEQLANLYPKNTVDLFGDLGVKIHDFEIWKSICLFDYDFLSEHSEEKENYRIISLEKLLFLTALASKKEDKYQKDLKLIIAKILEKQYQKSSS